MKCDEGGFLGLLGWGGGGSKEGRNRAARCGTRRGYVPVGSTPASLRVMVPHLAARFLRCHSPRYFGVSASASCQPQRRLRYVRVASTPASLRVMHTLLPSSCCAHPAIPRILLPTARSRKAACKTITDRMSVLSPHGWVHGVSCKRLCDSPSTSRNTSQNTSQDKTKAEKPCRFGLPLLLLPVLTAAFIVAAVE